MTEAPPTRVFGRRKGRPLRVRKAMLMDEFLPRVQLVLREGEKLEVTAPLVLEIGFGGGEHLAAQAKLHPETHFIGCEPFVNGVASLLDHLEREKIENVRVFNDDARLVLDALPPASLERCFVLFADPWPKSRHAERRFIGPENLPRLARAIKKGGVLRLASDHPGLVAWMRESLTGHADFTCIYDSSTPPPDWVPTRYQEKAIAAGRTPFFMDYRRN
ncbi:MAG: tRNA (guanosine(46)-N7)-methyltransferase TrmB [Alphaproteobacteria bacterium]|nr:tRNA (guanosine(46)-N7)-methyltransferase TrmB [Alphaproteobacteria bacterium]